MTTTNNGMYIHSPTWCRGVKKPVVYDVRQYKSELFLGEWVAAPPLLEDPVTEGPRVAASGSGIAAALAPTLRKLSIEEAGLRMDFGWLSHGF